MAGGSSSDEEGSITGINVTPFVDIALVLLIIFMVTAKYIVTPQAIPVDLPHASTSNAVSVSVRVSIDASGAIFADTRSVTEEQLVSYMRGRHADNPEVRAVIAADQRVPHGRVVHVLDLVRHAGVSKFAIETQAESVAEVSP